MVSAVPTSDLNLDLCAQEPIRIPGSIQPHGILVVVDPESRQIVQASANASALLGGDRRSSVLGLSLPRLIGESAERQITSWLRHPDSNYLRTLDINGQRLQVIDSALDFRVAIINFVLRRTEKNAELTSQLQRSNEEHSQLKIALLNLAVNARDAMSNGGKLCIETSNVDLRSDGHSAIEDLPRGEYVVIDVRDTGIGMSPEVLARAFEPCFTTKTPAARPDADVRAFTVETVRELGYDVLEARDGNSALNVLRQTPTGKIDLLFSDVVLPGGMNGQELAQQALALHSRLKVLFATGYARDVIVHHGRLDPGVQLITKPFSFEDLAARLRSVLDGQDSSRHVN